MIKIEKKLKKIEKKINMKIVLKNIYLCKPMNSI